MATINELQLDLQRVNSAIAALIDNERLTSFRIGSGTSIREYRYQEISMDMLERERARLLSEIATSEESTAAFRSSSVMKTTWAKL